MANETLNYTLRELVVVASQDGRIQALDANDGQAQWTQTCGHWFAGLALVQVGHEVAAVSGDGYVCLLALADGAVRWEVALPLASEITSPTAGIRIAANQQLVVVQLGKTIFALALADGHTVWEARSGPATYQWWLLAAGEEYIYTLQQEPALARLHAGSAAPTQLQPSAPPTAHRFAFVTTALSAWDGTPQWFAQEASAAGAPPWDAGASLLEQDGMVYAYGREGLHAFEAARGAPLWTCDTVPSFHVGALALGRDVVVVVADRHLGAYRRDTGTALWSQTAAKRADSYFEWFTTPVVLGDAVCVGRNASGSDSSGSDASGFHLESYDLRTGAPRWVWPTVTPSAELPNDVSWRYRGAGAALYVPAPDALWAIKAADGHELWRLSYDFRSGFNALLAVTLANS